MKLKTIYFLLSLAAFLLVSSCAITHKFGPYYGKVVDAETNEPIEGAVVLLRFYTEFYTPAGFNSKFADALETMTDSNGEFKVPAHRITLFRIPARWDPYGCYVITFKPGYGCYPEHRGTFSHPMLKPKGSIPSNEDITIKLPKLKTIEERKKNLFNIGAIIPDEKMRKLIRLESVERVNVGLSPYPAYRLDGGHKNEK